MRRAGGVLLVLALLVAGAFGLLLYFNSRDDAEVATPPAGIGDAVDSRCPQGEPLLTRDRIALAGDERTYLLSLGNVVIQGPVKALEPLQERLAGRYDPEFALAGQAIYLEPADAVRALAWRRSLDASGPDDERLEDFVSRYLGRGAQGECE